MSRTTRARTARRLTVLTGMALVFGIAFAGPASAHVEVEAEGAGALAENVTLDFTAESESDKAGITKLEVILPKGITPADVTYKDGPKGWKLAATERGYTVSGPKVAIGEDAAYSVEVRQLPDAKSLAFKTLQTYSDGRVDRWIELEESTGAGHGSLAPVLQLDPAEPGAEPVPPSPTAEPTSAAPSAACLSTPAAKDDKASDDTAKKKGDSVKEKGDDSSPAALVIIGVAALLVLLAGGIWWWKRRSAAGQG
ncbi:hypothetical protein SALBM135S_07615 [Streptomyces alboniger]